MGRLMFDDVHETMAWDEIDAVVFDVGQVLLTFDPDRILHEYLPDQPSLYPVLMRKVFRSPYWVMRDHGEMSCEEAVNAMTGRDESLRQPIDHIMHAWMAMKDVIQEGVDAVKTCKAHGKRLYVLSNYADDAFTIVEGKYDFFNLFDERFVSARLHLMKPSEQLFNHVVAATKHDPSRMLFIDDSTLNVEGALFCCWQAICYNEPGKLNRFFGARDDGK